MTDLRTAAQQALEAMLNFPDDISDEMFESITALKAALAEPVQEPKPVEFDHGIGADRFKVVRGAFWWHVLIGDSPTKHGKFHSRASAEKMAADLLREFRNGAFVQREAALAKPVQEPVAWIHTDPDKRRVKFLEWRENEPGYRGDWIKTPLYAAPPQRKPLTDEEIRELWSWAMTAEAERTATTQQHAFARAIERAHGIGSQP